MPRLGPKIAVIIVVGFALVQGYRISKLQPSPAAKDLPEAPRQPGLASDLLPDSAALPTPPSSARNPGDDTVASWLDEFTRDRQAPPKADALNAEEKQQLVDYLVASSNIPFPQDPVFLREAFLENKDGEPAKLDQVIKGFEDGFAVLLKLAPPERLKAIHEASVSQISDLMGVYKELRGETGKSLTEVWQEPTMTGLRERSSRTIAELRALANRYQLDLPPDVIPEYAL
ncbi:hypothetical protein HYW67_01095 [Candidatus Parcubacteria bacterium]|nr:hypothetical protein [Candidatus Parcubacteria bacterium]